MKVLMFGWEFPPHNSGGLGMACFGLTRALAGAGVDVSFVLPKKSLVDSSHCKIIFAEALGEVTLHEIDSILSPYLSAKEYLDIRELLGENIASKYSHSLMREVLRYAKKARIIAKKEKFDIIHAHDWLSFLAGIEAKKISGKPLIAHVHATEFDRTGGNGINEAVYAIEKKGMAYADKVVTVSQFTKNIVHNKYNIPENKIEVVHNGIDEVDYIRGDVSPKAIKKLKEQGKKIVLFVGRITLQKGPDYFVRVACKVSKQFPEVLFVVAGSGDMEWKMIQEVAYQKIADKFIFAGFLRGKELDSVYQIADLYIMPSVSEPFGITPLESLMHGTPAIISKQSGVSEVVSHVLRADFWDIDDMADKVLSVLQNDVLKFTLSREGKKDVKKINWKKAAEKCILIYSNI